MNFYSYSKNGTSFLNVHKNEWNRLKKQAGPPEAPSTEQTDYIESLTEKSYAWTSTWPDHEHGYVANYEKEKQRQREADLAAIEASRQANEKKVKIRKNVATEIIKEARQKIFENSCYGKKLLSALHQSKTLEEREAQIQFLKELKEKRELEQKQYKVEPYCSFLLDKHASDEERCRRRTAIETAQQNRETFEKQTSDAAKAKEAQTQADLENTRLMKELLDQEELAEKKIKLLEKEGLDQCSNEFKKSKEERAKWEAEYSAKIEACRKQKEELNIKINEMVQKINRNRQDLPWAKKIYDTVEQIQEKEKEYYNFMIEKNIKLGEHRSLKRERRSKEKEKKLLEDTLSTTETNKLMAECNKQRRFAKIDKSICDRQSLLVKGQMDRAKKEVGDCKSQEMPPPNFGPSNKLKSALKKRMEQPPPWTGAQTQHEEFARNAAETLRDCKYKGAGRKVIDEYMKNNILQSLDIPNY